MYDTFMEGKDLYSEIASKAFKVPYEDCLEFYPDGTTNEEGKERRTASKRILLGLLYGRGIPSIAEQLGCSVDEAKEIKQSVFRGFPAIEKFEQDSLEMGRTKGYVTTVCGRKRRLPDLQLPRYEFKWSSGKVFDIDPLDFTTDITGNVEVPQSVKMGWENRLENAKFNQREKIINDAYYNHQLEIKQNGGKIAGAERQCVNARIQGSASELTKLAMIRLGNSERLKDLGFRMLVPIHDEVLCECPKENMKECAELLAKTMSDAAQEIIDMPIKCDVSVTECWYGEELNLEED